MMTRILTRGYLWLLLALLYSPILIIMIFSFTEAKVLGNWTGFSTKLYSSLFTGGMHHSLITHSPLPCLPPPPVRRWAALQPSASSICARAHGR